MDVLGASRNDYVTLSEKVRGQGSNNEEPYRVENGSTTEKINTLSSLRNFEQPNDPDGATYDSEDWDNAVKWADGKDWKKINGKPITKKTLKEAARLKYDERVRVNKPTDQRYGEDHLRNFIRGGKIFENPKEEAAFLANVKVESAFFKHAYEFGKSNGAKAKKWREYATGRKKENLGNLTYEDGWNYRGRGYIQLTGRWNYEWMQRLLKNHPLFKNKGIDIVNNPDQAADPDIAALIAVTFWKKKSGGRLAKAGQRGDVDKTQKYITGGINAASNRRRKKAYKEEREKQEEETAKLSRLSKGSFGDFRFKDL